MERTLYKMELFPASPARFECGGAPSKIAEAYLVVWKSELARNAIEAASITDVAIHPSQRKPTGRRNCPTILVSPESLITAYIMGKAARPFKTADQYSARMA